MPPGFKLFQRKAVAWLKSGRPTFPSAQNPHNLPNVGASGPKCWQTRGKCSYQLTIPGKCCAAKVCTNISNIIHNLYQSITYINIHMLYKHYRFKLHAQPKGYSPNIRRQMIVMLWSLCDLILSRTWQALYAHWCLSSREQNTLEQR